MEMCARVCVCPSMCVTYNNKCSCLCYDIEIIFCVCVTEKPMGIAAGKLQMHHPDIWLQTATAKQRPSGMGLVYRSKKTTDQEDKGGGRWQNIKGHALFSDVISLL